MGAGERHKQAAATLLPGLPHGPALPARLGSEHPTWWGWRQLGCGDGSALPGNPRQALVRALVPYVQPGTEMGCEPL